VVLRQSLPEQAARAANAIVVIMFRMMGSHIYREPRH